MRKALLFLPLALLCSLFGYALHEMVHVPPAFASGIGGGGGTGTAGPTGPTGPAWTTSAEARASMSDESGTGAMLFAGGDIGTATGTRLTLTQGVSAVTGTFTNGITITRSTAGVAVTGTGNGGNAGASFTGGASTGGHGVIGTPGLTSGCGVYGQGLNSASSYTVCGFGAGSVGNGGSFSTAQGNAVLATASTTGTAVNATATAGGIALSINGDTTSPAVGQIRMPVLDTNPTSCQVGDMFMFTGGVLRVCTATTPTWVNVGSQ